MPRRWRDACNQSIRRRHGDRAGRVRHGSAAIAVRAEPGVAGAAARSAAGHEHFATCRLGRRRADRTARLRDSGDRDRSQDSAPIDRPAERRSSHCGRLWWQCACATTEGHHRGLYQEPRQERRRGRRSLDAVARCRWRRDLRNTRSFRRKLERALRARADRRCALRRQSRRARALRLQRGPNSSERPADAKHSWTKAMTASTDGRFLLVGIGSNSNITERGMEAEVDRAVVWQIDPRTGMHKRYAEGLRNPTALAIQPETSELWAV